MSERVTGTVIWFDSDRGFGFIDLQGQQIFVHYSGIDSKGYKTLMKDDSVEFEIIQGKKGQQADKVRVIE